MAKQKKTDLKKIMEDLEEEVRAMWEKGEDPKQKETELAVARLNWQGSDPKWQEAEKDKPRPIFPWTAGPKKKTVKKKKSTATHTVIVDSPVSE